MTPEDLAALGDNTTPGPWRVGARRICDVETSAGALVADCGVGVADARLVAAAPELREALVAALEEVERLRRVAEHDRYKAKRSFLVRERAIQSAWVSGYLAAKLDAREGCFYQPDPNEVDPGPFIEEASREPLETP